MNNGETLNKQHDSKEGKGSECAKLRERGKNWPTMAEASLFLIDRVFYTCLLSYFYLCILFSPKMEQVLGTLILRLVR